MYIYQSNSRLTVSFLFSCPVPETQRDFNPGAGAAEGSEETEGDR